MHPLSFKSALAQQFGSDRAFGLYFVTDDGDTLTLDQFELLADQLGDAMVGTESFLADGGSGVCCTDYAAFIYKALPGRVRIVGFANEDNPECAIATMELHPGGHDFAIVDDRYLVDPWCSLVAGVEDWQVVYDLRHPIDLALVVQRYGPMSRWAHMAVAEEFALRQLQENRKQVA